MNYVYITSGLVRTKLEMLLLSSSVIIFYLTLLIFLHIVCYGYDCMCDFVDCIYGKVKAFSVMFMSVNKTRGGIYRSGQD